MGTSIHEDTAYYTKVINDFGTKSPKTANGTLVFAGSYWPERSARSIVYEDVEFAFAESRKMIISAYLKASFAVRGDKAAGEYMERWFGERNLAAGPNDKDWWKGALAILGAIDDFITSDINVYYRGDNSLLGKPNDYPGKSALKLNNHDLSGFAESFSGMQNSIVGLCSLFFAKDKKNSVKMNRTGRDSVAGTLIHELSHNICATRDHATYDDTATCYGVGGCLNLASNKPSRAFYNADNIEYFCEDVLYHIAVHGPERAPKQTGAGLSVSSLGSQLQGKIPMAGPAPVLGSLPLTPAEWIRKTSRFGHTRSGELLALDKALEAYATPAGKNQGNLQQIKLTFNNWSQKNPKEVASRNFEGCIDLLKNFVAKIR